MRAIRYKLALATFVLSLVAGMAGDCAAAFQEAVSATITSDGKIQIVDGTVVPPYALTGAWKEFERKSSDRYDAQHFNYMVPGGAPAIELYVVAAKDQDKPDGIFEEGMVGGYIKAFAAEAGFSHSEPAFDERRIGAARVLHTLAKLEKGQRILWIHAYVFVCNPSMTFIAIRTNDGEGQIIEDYLARLK